MSYFTSTNIAPIASSETPIETPIETPVVAIHGSASNGGFWNKLAEACAGTRTVIAPDLPGYGKHDSKTTELESTLQIRAGALVDMVEQLPKGAHLVAHSFGASVALEVARVIPESIRSLTVYEPVVPMFLRDSGEAQDMALLGDLVALSDIVRGTASSVGMESFMNFWSEPGAWEMLPEKAQQSLSDLAPMVYQDFIEAYRNLAPKAFHQIRYQGPFKLILGAGANEHAKRMADLLIEQFPQAFTEVLKDMGHMGPLTHPGRVNQSILKHIAGVDAQCPDALLCAEA